MINYNTATDVNESEFEDLRDIYEITTKEQIIENIGDVVVLKRFASNYDYLYNRVVDVAALCWNNKDENGEKLQKSTFIKFKKDIDDSMVYELPLNRFMVSLVFLRTVLNYIDYINIDDYILKNHLSEKYRGIIQDKIVETLTSYGKTIAEIQVIMARMSLDLKELLMVFSAADMQIFTAENLFLDHYRRSAIVRDINNTEYPPDMQTVDIIEANAEKYKLLEKEMIEGKNPFFIDNKYTNIIKPKQMEELYINFSQIPDGKNIVPVIMNGNGFRAGYHDMPVMYAGAIAARVPDILNEEYMGTAGYFARNLWILTYGTLSRTVWDCGSINPIEIEIDDVMMDMMDGRYYQEQRNRGPYKIFKKDPSLLGRKLWFRSPCTCNLNEDCCHVCYGTKALKVGELEGGFIYSTELITKDVGQKILSVKHILKASAEKIEFSEGYEKYFVIENSTLIPTDEKKFDIYLKEDYLDNISESLTVYIGKDLFPVTISKYASIHIPDAVTYAFKEVTIDDMVYYKISSHKVIEEGMFCDIIPVNIMLTAKYMKIMGLFENDITKFEKIEDAVSELTHLMHGIIPVLSVHGEIIIGHLIRSAENKLLRPNWTKDNPEYQFMRLKSALGNSESVSVGLAFETPVNHLLRQIFDERNKIKRVGPRSFEDYIFGGRS